MKRILPLIVMALLSISAQATVFTVTVSDFQFAPTTLPSVKVGDTVMWVWMNGSHTTTSVSVPTGAATWDQPLNSGSTSFSYKVTVAGAYTYHCTPHAPNMAASFTAQSASGIPTATVNTLVTIMPNPASNVLHLGMDASAGSCDISIFDALGRCVTTVNSGGRPSTDIPTTEFANGLYIVHVIGSGSNFSQAFEVRH